MKLVSCNDRKSVREDRRKAPTLFVVNISLSLKSPFEPLFVKNSSFLAERLVPWTSFPAKWGCLSWHSWNSSIMEPSDQRRRSGMKPAPELRKQMLPSRKQEARLHKSGTAHKRCPVSYCERQFSLFPTTLIFIRDWTKCFQNAVVRRFFDEARFGGFFFALNIAGDVVLLFLTLRAQVKRFKMGKGTCSYIPELGNRTIVILRSPSKRPTEPSCDVFSVSWSH